MEPDRESFDEFRRAWDNILVCCLGWDEARVAAWVQLQFETRAAIPQFYNNPPAFYVVKEFMPESLRSQMTAEESDRLWLRIYQALESRGHWNDFAKRDGREAVCATIQRVLNDAGAT